MKFEASEVAFGNSINTFPVDLVKLDAVGVATQGPSWLAGDTSQNTTLSYLFTAAVTRLQRWEAVWLKSTWQYEEAESQRRVHSRIV